MLFFQTEKISKRPKGDKIKAKNDEEKYHRDKRKFSIHTSTQLIVERFISEIERNKKGSKERSKEGRIEGRKDRRKEG